MEKPQVFIGSSTEGLPLAQAVSDQMAVESVPILWTQDLFLPGQFPLDVLEQQLAECDFAVLVASPDDQLIKRGSKTPAMRDNLLLEFGLFTGALGRSRAFFLCPDQPQVELPSDLLGMIMATYDGKVSIEKAKAVAAAVAPACDKIGTVIQEEWQRMLTSRAEQATRIRESEIVKAGKRLLGVVIQLRDAIVSVQRDTFAAISNESAFRSVKKTAIRKTEKIAREFSRDADFIGVALELNEVMRVTIQAIEELPFDRNLVPGGDTARETLIDMFDGHPCRS